MKSLGKLLLAALLAASSAAPAATIEMDVDGLVCAFCAQGIEKKLRRLPGTADVFVSLEARIVAVELAEGADIDDATLREAITDSGYNVAAIRRRDGTLQDVRERVAAGQGDE